VYTLRRGVASGVSRGILLDSRASAEKFPGRKKTGKIPKNSKKRPKIALSTLFQGGRGQHKKDRKIAKKHQKIALLSLYLLYLYPRASAENFPGRGNEKKTEN